MANANRSRCHICFQAYQERYLQIDHRIPYEVAGDIKFDEHDVSSYMLLCGSCNRAKSWSCEHCHNWTDLRVRQTCGSCYWASPEIYRHIAMQDARRVDLVWLEEEVEVYDKLQAKAGATSEAMPDYVKALLRKTIFKK